MLPGVLLFVHLATAYAYIKTYNQENVGPIKSQYSYRNRHIYHSVPLDRANGNSVTGSEARGSDAVKLNNRNQAHVVTGSVMDDFGKRSKGGNEFLIYSNNLNYDRRLLTDQRRRNGRTRQDRISRNVREVRQGATFELYNGLPVWSYYKPEKKGKLANRNGNIFDDNAGESTVSYDGEETTTEEVDLANRMAFIGGNCPMNYAKVFKKCVRIR